MLKMKDVVCGFPMQVKQLHEEVQLRRSVRLSHIFMLLLFGHVVWDGQRGMDKRRKER